MTWHTRAACRGKEPKTTNPVRRVAAMKLLCADCPVRTECLAEALAIDAPCDVWGGLTPAERSALVRRRAS